MGSDCNLRGGLCRKVSGAVIIMCAMVSYLLLHSRVSTFLRSSLFSLEQFSTLWSDTDTAGSAPHSLNYGADKWIIWAVAVLIEL